MLSFLRRIGRLKMLPRSGWLSHGVGLRDVESIADHSFSVLVLSLVLADLEVKRGIKVDVEKVLRMAALHDIGEALTFDISKAYLEYLGKKGEVIKRELEDSAWRTLISELNTPQLANKYARIQFEYNAHETIESKIVHAADGLDILLQVLDYRQKGYTEPLLAELWNTTYSSLRKCKIASARNILKEVAQQNLKTRRTKVR